MAHYRKKPVVIEAVRFDHLDTTEWHNVPGWLRNAVEDRTVFVEDKKLKIKTLEGVMTADFKDWIICGVKGEIYPCKPDIFEATYEEVI
jgi:hypothetical protein